MADSKGQVPMAETTVRDATEDLCQYGASIAVNELLGEYAIRILRDRPPDPVSYLIQELSKRPFKPKNIAGRNVFYRDARKDSAEVRATLSASAAAFFATCQVQCARTAKAAQDAAAPSTLLHGAPIAQNLVNTATGPRLLASGEQATEGGAHYARQTGAYSVDFVAALVSASLCSEHTDRFDLGVLGTHVLRGYLRGACVVEPPSREDPHPRAPRPSMLSPPLGGEPLFEEDAPDAKAMLSLPRAQELRENPIDDDLVAKILGAYGADAVLESGMVCGRYHVALACGDTVKVVEAWPAPATQGLAGLERLCHALGAPDLLPLDGFVTQESEPAERHAGVCGSRNESERLALWLGASLGVLHAGGGGDVHALRSHAQATYRDHVAVAGDVAGLVAAAWGNYRTQVQGLRK